MWTEPWLGDPVFNMQMMFRFLSADTQSALIDNRRLTSSTVYQRFLSKPHLPPAKRTTKRDERVWPLGQFGFWCCWPRFVVQHTHSLNACVHVCLFIFPKLTAKLISTVKDGRFHCPSKALSANFGPISAFNWRRAWFFHRRNNFSSQCDPRVRVLENGGGMFGKGCDPVRH